MTTATVRRVGAGVVLPKPGTVASVGWAGSIILGTAVAARTTDRVEAGAAVRSADQHIIIDGDAIEGDAGVAGSAISVQHVVAMDVVEGVFPGLVVAERDVGVFQETSVTSLTAAVGGVRRKGLSCSRPDQQSTEQRNEKYQ
jgi:hypothetical protein